MVSSAILLILATIIGAGFGYAVMVDDGVDGAVGDNVFFMSVS